MVPPPKPVTDDETLLVETEYEPLLWRADAVGFGPRSYGLDWAPAGDGMKNKVAASRVIKTSNEARLRSGVVIWWRVPSGVGAARWGTSG